MSREEEERDRNRIKTSEDFPVKKDKKKLFFLGRVHLLDRTN